MKKRNSVFELFKLDWKRIFENKITLFLVIALMILPSLYAWFNIEALWDPYANTGDVAIAVYSDDQTITIKDKDVNIGEGIVENLKDNKSIGWQFVESKDQLDEGVKSGKYYAGIYLPKNFSKDLTSVITGETKKPEIEYSVNQKVNAITPKIADKGAGTIQAKISDEFVKTVSKTLLGVFNDVGFELDRNLVTINRLKEKVFSLEDNLDKADGYTEEILALNQKMPQFKNKLDQVNGMMVYLPQIDELGNKVIKANSMMPEIEESGKLILDVQKKIPEIKDAGRQLKMVDEDFDRITELMDTTMLEAKNAGKLIGDAQKVIPDIKDITVNINNTLPLLKEDLEAIEAALPGVAETIESGMGLVSIISNETVEFTDTLLNYLDSGNVSADKEIISGQISKISKNLETKNKMLKGLIKTLEKLQKITNSKRLEAKINKLKDTQSLVERLLATVNKLNNDLDEKSIEEIRAQVALINREAIKINSFINSIDIDELSDDVNNLLATIYAMLESAQNISGQVLDKDIIERLDGLMGSSILIIDQTLEIMEKYQAEMPKIKNEIHSASSLLNDNMDTIIGAINKSADLYKNDLPKLKLKLNTAAGFIERDLPGVENDIQAALNLANEKFPQLETGMAMAENIIRNDWPNIKAGVHKAADAIRRGEEEVDLSELVTILKRDVEKESDFMASPVELKQKDVYPIPNYGSASAPFYTALCLWVGAVLLASMATTDFHLSEEDREKYTMRQQFLARMLSFLVIGFFQALIVSLGNLYLLKIYCASPGYHILYSLIVGFTFMMMVYVLVALFGNLGKGAAVIILVLSISAGGGNFPIEMSGPFFRAINPLLPFTHAVNLLRESVGGIYLPTAKKSIAILLGFAGAFFAVGTLVYPPVKKLFKKLNDKLQDGHFLH